MASNIYYVPVTVHNRAVNTTKTGAAVGAAVGAAGPLDTAPKVRIQREWNIYRYTLCCKDYIKTEKQTVDTYPHGCLKNMMDVQLTLPAHNAKFRYLGVPLLKSLSKQNGRSLVDFIEHKELYRGKEVSIIEQHCLGNLTCMEAAVLLTEVLGGWVIVEHSAMLIALVDIALQKMIKSLVLPASVSNPLPPAGPVCPSLPAFPVPSSPHFLAPFWVPNAVHLVAVPNSTPAPAPVPAPAPAPVPAPIPTPHTYVFTGGDITLPYHQDQIDTRNEMRPKEKTIKEKEKEKEKDDNSKMVKQVNAIIGKSAKEAKEPTPTQIVNESKLQMKCVSGVVTHTISHTTVPVKSYSAALMESTVMPMAPMSTTNNHLPFKSYAAALTAGNTVASAVPAAPRTSVTSRNNHIFAQAAAIARAAAIGAAAAAMVQMHQPINMDKRPRAFYKKKRKILEKNEHDEAQVKVEVKKDMELPNVDSYSASSEFLRNVWDDHWNYINLFHQKRGCICALDGSYCLVERTITPKKNQSILEFMQELAVGIPL